MSIMIRLLSISILSILLGGIAMGQATADGMGAIKNDAKNDEARIQKTLATDISLAYDEIPFREVMDDLTKKLELNVVLDQSAKDDALSEDEPITFKIQNITAAAALHLMLEQRNATFVVHDRVLRVISMDVADDPRYFCRKIFDCRDLIETIHRNIVENSSRIGSVYSIEKPAQLDEQGRITSEGGLVLKVFPRDELKNAVDNNDQLSEMEKAKLWFYVQRGANAEVHLVDLVKSIIAPDSWDDTNGDGSAQFIGGCIVVSQSDKNIRGIEKLLDNLRETLAR